jgi:GcrA cell cycle regulator
MTDVDWTTDRVERLRVLWAQGYSHTQVAADLNCGMSRSAIAGKIMRLRLPPRDKGHPTPIRRAPPATLAPKPRPQRRNPSHNILAAIAIAEDEPGLPERLKGEAPDGTGIKFSELRPDTCRFPRGDPQEPDFEFCGARALTDKPYCVHHTRMSIAGPRALAATDRWARHRGDIQS